VPRKTAPEPARARTAVDPGALDVFVAGTTTGTLTRSAREADTYLFGYREDCADTDAVSLTMPVVPDQYDSMGMVHPIFEMNLPEGALLEKLRLLFAKTVEDFDALTLLSIVGRSQIGRIRYSLPGAAPEDVPAEDLDALLAHRGSEDLFRDLLARYATHSGVSGMQPKALVRSASAPERTTLRGATHIVKSFDPREFAELAANEFFCLRAAALAGIPAARAQLSDNRRLLVVERFDLRPDATYLGCEDFCVLNGLRSHGRYEGSYEALAHRIRQFVAPEHMPAALEQLFATVALCCAIENGDAHLTNFAVLYEDAERPVGLAPAYDLVSTTPYQPRDVLALTLAESKAFPDRARLSTFGRVACGLSESVMRRVLDRIAAGVEGSIAEMRAYAREHRDYHPPGERLVTTFRRGLARSISPAG
jgi:serine/threonine-protein kinase HipA